jgi:LysM repeat protein/uncharacterized protein YukE
MGFVSELEALFHPGGNPEAILAAAAATHSLASGLRETAKSLDSAAADMEESWHGIGGGEQETAAAKFQAAWSKFSKAIVDYAGQLDTDAAAIQQQGEALQKLQSQAVKLDWLAGITGAFLIGSIGFAIATGGISAEIEFEMAANEIAVASGVMTEMEMTIANALLMLENTVELATPVAAQFILGAVSDGAAVALAKLEHGQNPLDLSNWQPDDISNLLLGGLVVGAWGLMWNKLEVLAAFQDAHPVLSSMVWNSSGAFAWAVPWEFWIKGQPFDLQTWETVFESSAVSFVSPPFYKGLGKVIPILGRLLNDTGPSFIPEVTKSDIANVSMTLPISVEKLFFITGGPPFQNPSSPAAPAALPGVPAPRLPNPAPVPSVPAHIGGGTHTVQSGDSLYEISARTLGNPNLYPVLQAANPLTVGANGEIVPGQKLLIPVLPPVPKGSTAQVVQPGQSVSDFAGGNLQLEQEIAELNGLKNINLIYPGQVLIVPPAS